MKNRMDVPQEYEPVLPGKVEAHLAKKKAQAAENSLLTQTAIAVGKVIAQLRPVSFDTFDVRDLSPDELRDLKSACVNHLFTSFPASRKRASMIDLITIISVVVFAAGQITPSRPITPTPNAIPDKGYVENMLWITIKDKDGYPQLIDLHQYPHIFIDELDDQPESDNLGLSGVGTTVEIMRLYKGTEAECIRIIEQLRTVELQPWENRL